MAFRAARLPYDRAVREASETTATRFFGRVQYDGTNYVGWQTQPNGRGVQDALEVRLSSLLGGRVYVAGSGRTDKGVHARDQVFHFELPLEDDKGSSSDGGATDVGGAAGASGGADAKDVPLGMAEKRQGDFQLGKVRHVQLKAALTAADDTAVASVLESVLAGPRSDLPEDIKVMSIAVAPAGFHSRDSCVGKRYVYAVEEGIGSPFTNKYRWVLGRGKRLDVEKMAAAAALLTGTHDFSTFGVREADDPRPPVKRMRRLEVRRASQRDAVSDAAAGAGGGGGGDGGGGGGDGGGDDRGGGVVTICAECDRFLYNMMRMVSGTLVQVGLGKLSVEDVGELLRAKGRKGGDGAAVFKAPAQGLCLERCFLEEEDGEWTDAPPPVAVG